MPDLHLRQSWFIGVLANRLLNVSVRSRKFERSWKFSSNYVALDVEQVFEMMCVLVIDDCQMMALMRVLALLLRIPGKLFLITSGTFRTFLVFFGVKGKLIINFFFSLCSLMGIYIS